MLRDSTISDNRVAATTANGSAGSADATEGAGELNADDTISNTRVTGNTVTATFSAGDAHAENGGILPLRSSR